MFRTYAVAQQVIYGGQRGENLARCICFPLTDLQNEFGVGTWSVVFQRPGETTPYVVTDTAEVGAYAVWGLNDVDTAIEGEGKCELRYYIDETHYKTKIFPVIIRHSLGVPGEIPDPYQDLIDTISGLKADAEAAAAAAAQSAEEASGVIGESVRWDQAQDLTEEAKTTARTNIGAAASSEVETLAAEITGVETALSQAQTDIDAAEAAITQAQADIITAQTGVTQNAGNISQLNAELVPIRASIATKADQSTVTAVQNTVATIQTTDTASKNYEVGEYLVLNGILYEVTVAIPSGGTIVPGTNCEKTNMGAELTAANAEIAAVKESLSTIDYSTQIVKNADTNPVVLKIYKTGRLVTLEYVGGSLTHVMNEVLFTIPTDCRPELGLYIYANANSNATGYGASVNIKQNGEVAALPQNTSSAHRLCFTVTYVSAS